MSESQRTNLLDIADFFNDLDELRFPSNRANWGQAGACPKCGFRYRWDGARCSHCGDGVEAAGG